ncbi:WXG100 family type VII secretion target [Neobacillus sp. 114]|uniref:WXG100 family type VII secretion target n=1 Tax=Neobacillus sp. 114 TaxID=3048535 RepID=UPI0024C3C488|nr:WXG100 family type VII secretion target [Neobacillus sp. 114]
MADFIKVDTARVSSAAKYIANYNNRIRDDFSSVESAMRVLNNAWDGAAASRAMSAFHEIRNAFHEPRYEVLQNYVAFLQQTVDSGYTQTEKTNTSLSKLFL